HAVSTVSLLDVLPTSGGGLRLRAQEPEDLPTAARNARRAVPAAESPGGDGWRSSFVTCPSPGPRHRSCDAAFPSCDDSARPRGRSEEHTSELHSRENT